MKKKILLLAAVVLLVSVALATWFVMHRVVQFNIIEITPGKSVPTDYSRISIKTNRTLNAEKTTVAISGQDGVSVTFNDASVVLSSGQPFEPNSSMKVTINAVSTEGDTATFVEDFTFTDALTKDKDEELIKQEQTNDSSLARNYPLINALPYRSETFEIDFAFPDNDAIKMPIFITNTELYYEDLNADPGSKGYVALYKKNRKKAIDYLNENGYTKELYQIYYTEPYGLEPNDLGLYKIDYTLRYYKNNEGSPEGEVGQ